MLIQDDDASVKLLCSLCGRPILAGQAFIKRNNRPIHSDSADCDPDKTPKLRKHAE
jgi:hypothetical protein